MTEPADLDDVHLQLQALIDQHKLRQVAADYATPAVFLDADTAPAEVVEIAASTHPAFVSLSITRFDPDTFSTEIAETLERRREAISPAGRDVIGQHHHRRGAVQDLALQWVGQGVLYAYIVVADWYLALQEAVEESAQEREDEDRADWRAQRARAAELMTALEADPAFRAAPPAKRRATGDRLLDSYLSEDDHHLPQLGFIVQEAVRLAAANAADAIAALDATAIAESAQWRAARTQQTRTDLAERLLVEQTGYGCNRSAADAFRRRVDAAAGR